MRKLVLRAEHWSQMRVHVEEEAPLEACGLLAGSGEQVEAVLPVPNRLSSPTRFLMEPVEQLKAFEWIDERGLELLGIYHSHPSGPRGMSETDIAEAAYPVVHMIWSPLGGAWEPRGFRLLDGRVEQVSLEVVDE